MIWGIGEIFCTPGDAQGGAQGADLGAQREQITALNFVPFWYPYFKSRQGIAMKPHFVNIQSPVGTRAGAVTGADISADTKVKIFSQENSLLPKGDKLVYDKT